MTMTTATDFPIRNGGVRALHRELAGWVLVVDGTVERGVGAGRAGLRALRLQDYGEAASSTPLETFLGLRTLPRAILVDVKRAEDGVRALRFLREAGLAQSAPTLLAAPREIARALQDPAVDDILITPHAPGELVERIRRAERRRASESPPTFVVWGDLHVDFAAREVTVAGARRASDPAPVVRAAV